jgi:REP element-mobilizing transposase RayT
MDVRSTRHSKYSINYHLVWIPKYRHPVLTGEVADHLRDIFQIIAEKKRNRAYRKFSGAGMGFRLNTWRSLMLISARYIRPE